MRPRPAREQRAQRVMGRRQRRIRQPRRRRDPDPVPVAAHVLGRDPALLARDPDRDRAPIRDERLEPLPGGALAGTLVRAPDAGGDLGGREVAEPAQEVVDGIDRAGGAFVRERLEVELEVRQGVRVEELAQLLRRRAARAGARGRA